MPPTPANRLEPNADHFVGEVGQLADAALVRLHRDRHDRRIVRIEVLDDRLVDVRRQRPPNSGDLRLNVLLRDADVDAEVERDANVGAGLRGAGVDLLDSLNGVERLLHRLGDLAHHHVGRRTGIRRRDADDRIGDVRVLVDGQPLVADEAEDDERHHEHGGEHRSLDGNVREKHQSARLG